MKAVCLNPNLPCLSYALKRIGFSVPEKIQTLNQFLNYPAFDKAFCTDFSQCSTGDIITWVDTAKERGYSTGILEDGEVKLDKTMASFHCAVIEDENRISHLLLSGGTMYTVVVENLDDYLARRVAPKWPIQNNRLKTKARSDVDHPPIRVYNVPALVFRWEGYNG